ncbi:SIMPL domain-containing protein [Granulicella sibirica]|uniref:DUF541 domain-containing protein n=1 Tax=Granulicella sibirica TaxID=2479048 RepID=A0A4Q0T9R1_9BACT|nr:SIMPL domain-containing protein [Granulicella sibirica]RXH58848.1 Protein of unknown function DUF541 [Granulicella sibirica]
MRLSTKPFLLLAAFAATLPVFSQTIQVNKDNRTIAITATDEASAPADLAAVTVGFETFGADQAQTYADATRTSNAINDALKAAGVQPDQIESREQNLSPIDENDKLHFAKGLRFRFSQSWQVTVPAANAAATLHAAVLAGANNSGNIEWKLKSEDAVEGDAAAKALEHAHKMAERMAQGLGIKLGPLVYASNQAQARPVMMMSAMARGAAAPMPKALKPLAISPEKITRSATVYAVFSVE